MHYKSFITGFILLFIVYHLPEFFSLFWLMAVCKIGILLLAYVIARWQGWKGLGGFGLALKDKWAAGLLTGLGTGILFFSLSLFFSTALKYVRVTAVEPVQVIAEQMPMILLMTVFPSIAEDILTRGYLYGHLRNKVKAPAWITISASVFLLNHIWRLNEHPAVLLYLFLLGLVLAVAVWIKGNLWLAFGIHWGSNLAFEFSNAFVKTSAEVHYHEDTFMLAASWFLLLMILLISAKRKSLGL
ncbi:MAG TPA: CPBP family intramembrane metalloprotease [Chitinophagaceae bacterium]|nr:CPBP family intramembrane metalloprotease [Chitinophagaceae bacterium]